MECDSAKAGQSEVVKRNLTGAAIVEIGYAYLNEKKQAAAKQTFVFLTPLASESLAKQVKKCESTN